MAINPLLRESILIIGAKRTMLKKEKNNLDTLVLGSSHGDFGFNPTYFPGSFNLCCRSQDLKHSFYIYKHIIENYPKIKNLALYYSAFSSGSFLEMSPTEKFISPALNELFNLNINYTDKDLNIEYDKIKNKLTDLEIDSSGIRGFLPNNFKGFFPESYGAANRANDHMKYNKKEEANVYLIHTLLLAKNNNHKVCIIIPPVRSDYKEATGMDFSLLFKSLLKILNNFHPEYQIKLINGFDSKIFNDNHFGDYDHLLPLGKGTELLSKLIYKTFI